MYALSFLLLDFVLVVCVVGGSKEQHVDIRLDDRFRSRFVWTS